LHLPAGAHGVECSKNAFVAASIVLPLLGEAKSLSLTSRRRKRGDRKRREGKERSGKDGRTPSK